MQTEQQTERQTDRPTNIATYRAAITAKNVHLKGAESLGKSSFDHDTLLEQMHLIQSLVMKYILVDW